LASEQLAAVDVQNAVYTIGPKRILDGVSWRINEGERWAVLGPNGSGKTTLLKMVCGYIWPNGGGEVLRNGQSLLDLRELRESIGWVSSYLCGQIPPRQSVLDTVVSGKSAQLRFWQYDGTEVDAADFERARRFLDELGCAALAGEAFGKLSQGEQQKVLIARARMARPFLIILDEPCAGLDPGARERFLKSIDQLAARQPRLGLVLVTHHIEEITPAFTHVIVLKNGRVLHAGAAADVLAGDGAAADGAAAPGAKPGLIEQLYGVPLRVVCRSGRYWPVGE